MKVVITGHSAGIGKTVYNQLINDRHDVVGFSLENGYDIGLEDIRQQIINASINADIFINNAYHLVGQIDLLKKIITAWQGQDKIIINMGSKVTNCQDFNDYNNDYTSIDAPIYVAAKKKLQEIVKDRTEMLPKICNIIPGMVDTELTKDISCSKLSTNTIADIVKYVLDHKDNVWIQEIILENPILELK